MADRAAHSFATHTFIIARRRLWRHLHLSLLVVLHRIRRSRRPEKGWTPRSWLDDGVGHASSILLHFGMETAERPPIRAPITRHALPESFPLLAAFAPCRQKGVDLTIAENLFFIIIMLSQVETHQGS